MSMNANMDTTELLGSFEQVGMLMIMIMLMITIIVIMMTMISMLLISIKGAQVVRVAPPFCFARVKVVNDTQRLAFAVA